MENGLYLLESASRFENFSKLLFPLLTIPRNPPDI